MAAMASAPPWIPEDDLLLKNAMEAGASLEALAKGAVRFSRKFSVRDLRERWHSLLYDADVSAEASVRMLEFEACNSNVPSKFNRFSQSRGSKRKAESIRKQYHALRKRLALIGTCALLMILILIFLVDKPLVLLVEAKGLGQNAYCQDNNDREDLSTRGVNAIDFGNSLDAEDIGAHLWDVSAPKCQRKRR
ncbi:hypothetical protein M0R45_004064 [Rubus argutus]|uniref:Microspherule protein N-terminal domain-containing protein n=1 Tax=Rubus argutus TaxID=59490 RepID=A0AAW1YIJ5_RUBAR